jgi:hypothetical protein
LPRGVLELTDSLVLTELYAFQNLVAIPLELAGILK